MPTSLLSATAHVFLSTPDKYLGMLTDYFAEYGAVARSGRAGNIELSYGRATLLADHHSLHLTAEGDDETGLAYVKFAIANHLLEFASKEKPRIVWTGDGLRGQRRHSSAKCALLRPGI